MPEKDNLDRRMRRLTLEHAETRWLALRLDDDVKVLQGDMRTVQATQREHTARFDRVEATQREHSTILLEHSARFDRVDATQREHSTTLLEHSATLQEHTARFDSIDSQLRSLTQMVGQALERLPEGPCGG